MRSGHLPWRSLSSPALTQSISARDARASDIKKGAAANATAPEFFSIPSVGEFLTLTKDPGRLASDLFVVLKMDPEEIIDLFLAVVAECQT